MERKIYVVMGAAGEYSDRTEWLVAAYTEEKDAKQHVEWATRAAKVVYLTCMSMKKHWRELKIKNLYDSNLREYTSDTRYYYDSVELLSELVGTREKN